MNLISFKHLLKISLFLLGLLSLSHFYDLNAQAPNLNQPSIAQQQVAPPVFMTPTTPVPLNSPVKPAIDQIKSIQNKDLSSPQISLSFENIPAAEFVRYVSKVARQNFIFDEEDLQFTVTVISAEPISIDDLVTLLLQRLRIHDLLILEQGDNLIIYRNPRIKTPGQIISGGTEFLPPVESEVITRIFDLNTLNPTKASELMRPLLSEDVSVEVLRDSNKLIVTDFVSNIDSIAELLNNLDAPKSGTQIGHYVVRNGFADTLAEIANQIILPITQGNPFSLIPNSSTNSIYIVSNDYFVQKALALLQNLDMNEGKTKVLTLEGLQAIHGNGVSKEGTFIEGKIVPPTNALSVQGAPPQPLVKENIPSGQPTSYPFEGRGTSGRAPGTGIEGQTRIDTSRGFPIGGIGTEGEFLVPGGGSGNPTYRPGFRYTARPEGEISSQGYYEGTPSEEHPYGVIASQGRLAEIETRPEFIPGELTSAPQWLRELPKGTIESSGFYEYKVKYRKAAKMMELIQKNARGAEIDGTMPEIAAALRSASLIEGINSIMFFGPPLAIEKVIELVETQDTPLRQVFVETLILEADYVESLTLGVEWGTSFGGGNTNGVQAFQVPGLVGQALNVANAISPTLLPTPAYSASVFGTHLTHGGLRFSTFGAFVQAINSNAKINIVTSPKIVVGQNVTCQVYNGTVDRYKTQSIPNDLGTLITNNYQYLEVGLTLQVTARINSNDTITLDLNLEQTSPIVTTTLTAAPNANDVNLEPVLTKLMTSTRLTVPNSFFTVLSGSLQDNQAREILGAIPCLGSIPIVGGLCKNKAVIDTKKNLMLFLRPFIIDTEEQFEEVTKRQQDVWCEKSKWRRSWNYEIDEALEQFNLKRTDPDEIGCGGCNQ